MSNNRFDGTDDVLDSRDIIERIDELIAEFTDATDTDPEPYMSEDDWAFGLNADDAAELVALIEFRDDADGVSDWEYGAIFVHEDYFTDYVRELAEDIGAVSRENADWIVIDWEATAENVQVDYADFEFRGATYWVRA